MGGVIFKFLPKCIANLLPKFSGDERLEKTENFRRFQEKEILTYTETL